MNAQTPEVVARPPVSLRRGGPEDAARFSLVGKATFLESYAGFLPLEDIMAHGERQHAPQVYASWLANPACGCWLAEADTGGAPVGYQVLGPPDLALADLSADDVEIKRLYLLHRFQRRGLGRLLMDVAGDWARERGCRRLLLGVYSRNLPALAFYDRVGFTRVGERHFRVGANDYFDYILGRAI